MKPVYLCIEAAVCALPSMAVGAVGALIFLGSGISMLGYNPAEGVKGIAIACGIVHALLQYMTLAARTIFGERYEFGILFWLAVFFGSLGVWFALNGFGAALGSAIALPIVGATLHFIWRQAKEREGRNVAV